MSSEEHLAFWLSVEQPPGCFVYVIQAEGDSPVKIGWAVDVPKRIAELQTGNPRRLRLIHLLVGEQRLEHNLHRRIGRPSRLMGEWFDGEEVTPVLDLVRDLAVRMVATYETTGELPRWWRLLPDWQLHSGARTNASGHLRVRHTTPSPVPPDVQQQRMERAFIRGGHPQDP